MNEKQLVNTFLKENFETTASGFIAREHGFCLRQTKDSRKFEAWELGSTYFYQSQSHLSGNFTRLSDFCQRYGFKVTPLTVFSGIEVSRFEVKANSHWDMKTWPKDSWNTIYVKFEKIEE